MCFLETKAGQFVAWWGAVTAILAFGYSLQIWDIFMDFWRKSALNGALGG
ncbi:hypothetical protein MUK70_28155 [Dyadobacter chenwenxiniae]|nr:hypothetical protein [Dyadobacter chenwenxiniae]UON82882.1 hypothetical protein MUK70_28155 [Dyadobacter chenwenxiniae]